MKFLIDYWPTATIAVLTYILAPIFRNWISYNFAMLIGVKNQKQKIFEEYSKRYSHILSSLIEQVSDFHNDFDPKNPRQRKYILQFYMLISEEFYLYNEKLIDDKIWALWDEGIKFHMRHHFFVQGWNHCRGNMDFEGPFSEFIDSYIKIYHSSSRSMAA